MPALSPDGKKLAFVWRGDIWVTDGNGGRAYPVTSHVELDANPVFSPDGKWIAFSSTRNGNWDIFVVPTVGGEARQLTFSSGSEIATDWTPDGKTLIFTGKRDSVNSTVFALDVATLRFKKLTEDYKNLGEVTTSPDGKRIAFQRYGFPWTRPRYQGSAAAQLWTLDLPTGKRTALADNERQHLWPRWMPGGKEIVCVTYGEPTPNAQWLNKPLPPLKDSAARTPNLWTFPAGGGAPKQRTFFTGGSVRFPTVARQSGDIVFEHEHDLYRLAPGAKEPVKLALFCGSEDKQNNIQRQTFTNSQVAEAEISPDGKTFGFGLKGDLWTIPVEQKKGDRNADLALRLTDYPGSDHDFNWSKDGKEMFFISDRGGSDGVYAVNTTTKAVRTLWTGAGDAYGPSLTPDGKSVYFWVRGSTAVGGGPDADGLYLKPSAPADAGTPAKRLIALPGALQFGSPSFSPDMKWVAYTRRGIESGGVNIYIAPADGSGTAVNVTKLNAFHGRPTWSPDGRFLFFSSNRDGSGLYVLPLQPEDAREDELEIKFEKPKAPVAITIDFEDTPQRIRKISGQNPDADLTVTDEGQIFFVSGGDAYRLSFDGKESTKLTNGGGVSNLRVSADGKTLYFYRGGALFTLRNQPPYPTTQVAFTAQWERDVRAERKAAFNEFWRSYNTRFYDGNFHGRDWSALRTRYEPLLEAVGTREEFATLLNMMIGEVEASHSEVGAAPSGINGPSTRHLGVYFDYTYEGPGIKVKDVPKRAPGSYARTRIKPGEYIVAVDGQDVTLDENLFKVLNDKGNRDFVLLVNDKPTRQGARTVTYRALTSGEWNDIHYRNRTEWLRKLVDQKSKGEVAYVHIAGMGGTNQVLFDRELYEYAEGKKAVIIDVRFNGGGNIADTLLSWLNMKPYGTYLPRNGYPQPAPNRSWNKPIVVLMNEHSYSNAEMFPYDMRATGLAKLVGMPTPGYVIWTTGLQLVDGTNARMPGSGVFRKDGSPLENMGEQPDYKIPLSNEDWLAERDPQLEKAIELLTK
jgi:Periplasmic protease